MICAFALMALCGCLYRSVFLRHDNAGAGLILNRPQDDLPSPERSPRRSTTRSKPSAAYEQSGRSRVA